MKKLYFVIIACVLSALTVVYYRFNPAKYGFFPKCPFYTLTGLQCPGCGSQRAIYCLLHGQVYRALQFNMLMVAAIPFLAIHFGYKIAGLIRQDDTHWRLLHHPLTSKIIFVLVLIFGVARNLHIFSA